jgi:hypothetical protein|tara:strand:- start:6518 stop:6853 length:336 start_codon:yes stop_codon:yes gene_type:complete
MTENISWEEATTSGRFVAIKTDVEKKIAITNWRFEKRALDVRIAPGAVELIADVTEEDGKPVSEKLFTTASNRLKKKLRPILEKKNPKEIVKIAITKVGEQFNTQYSVKQL